MLDKIIAPHGEHRDLRTGESVWQKDGLPRIHHTLDRTVVETDVVIVGAGITGALTADLLTEAGMRVAIVDRRDAVRGSTVASTALLQFEIDTPLIRLKEKIGADKAERAWLRAQDAVSGLARRATGIACDWTARESVYLPGNLLDEAGIAAETKARQHIGLPSSLIEHAELLRNHGLDRALAVLSRGCADVDPVALASGLLRRALERGAVFFAPHEIAEVDVTPGRVVAHTNNALTIHAGALVYATGYELQPGVPRDGQRITASWALATVPQPERLWPSRCLVWESSEPYLYTRTSFDGRVIVGGEDEKFDDEARRDALLPQKIKTLQNKLHALFPDIDTTAEFAWAGTFGESETGLPTIGPLPDMPGCYAAQGYGGNGISFGFIAAEILRGYLCGPMDADADLFAFGANTPGN